TGPGVGRSWLPPSPSWPQSFAPQHERVPSTRRAHVKNEPAAICAKQGRQICAGEQMSVAGSQGGPLVQQGAPGPPHAPASPCGPSPPLPSPADASRPPSAPGRGTAPKLKLQAPHSPSVASASAPQLTPEEYPLRARIGVFPRRAAINSQRVDSFAVDSFVEIEIQWKKGLGLATEVKGCLPYASGVVGRPPLSLRLR